jgi:quercetin dioxygenase-like cupin family protein
LTESNDHFTDAAGGIPQAPGRFVSAGDIVPVEMLPGLEFQPVLGGRTLVNFVSFGPRTETPYHVHEEEQIVVVLEGECEFNIDGNVRTMQVGDVAVIPSWVPHGARTLDTTCRELDVFTPPRQTLLDLVAAQATKG